MLWKAKLTSNLTTRITTLPFDSVKSLLDKSNLNIGLAPGTANEDIFKFSNDPEFQRAYKERIEPYLDRYKPYGRNLNDLLLDGKNPDVGAVYEGSYIHYKEYTECKLVLLPTKYDFKPGSFGLQKNSPFLPLINYYLLKMEEAGALNQIRKKYETKPPICPDYTGKALGFNSSFSAFSVWLCGAILAVALFSIEIFSKLIGKKFSILECYDKINVLETKIPSNYDEIRNYICSMESKIKELNTELGEMKIKQRSQVDDYVVFHK